MGVDILLTKHLFGDLNIDSKDLIGIYGPRRIEKPGLSDEDIAECIRAPIGTAPLGDLVRGKQKILIVTDDNTRLTPLSRLLPPILSEIEKASIKKDNITILIGLGTHRPMSKVEIRTKFGAEISGSHRIVNHSWNDPGSLVSLGVSDLGYEIVINRLTQEADFIMSVGTIVPHATTGFSGGGKTVMPGICGARTIEETHWTALNYSISELLGNFNNRVRDTIVNICRKINLDFIVNTVLLSEGSIYGLVAGDVEDAHRLGSEMCRSIYGIAIPEKADIVVAEAYPTDIDLRQAIKAICACDLVCKDRGVVILVADCREGVAPQFPNFSRYGFSDPEQVYNDVETGKFREKLLAYTLVAIGRIISKRVRAILVCPNIDREVTERLGFLWSSDLSTAWDMARKITASAARTIVLKEAGELLPLLSKSFI